jgi:hypothetical protein
LLGGILLHGERGGERHGVVLRFYFFSLPMTVADFCFNFFERGVSAGNAGRRSIPQENAGLRQGIPGILTAQ